MQKKKMMLIAGGILLILGIILLLVLGKGKGTERVLSKDYLKDNTIGKIEIKDNVKFLEDSESIKLDKSVESVTEIDENKSLVIFKKIPDVIKNFQRGEIFITKPLEEGQSIFANGYIGVVEGIDKDNNSAIIRTPLLEEVFNNIDISETNSKVAKLSYVEARGTSQNLRGIEDNGAITVNDTISVAYKEGNNEKIGKYFETLEVSFKDLELIKNDKVSATVNGSIKLEDLVVNPIVKYDEKSNTKLSDVKLAGDVTNSISLKISGDTKGISKDFQICYIAWDLGRIEVGAGKDYLILGAGISIYTNINGEVKISTDLTLKNEFSFDVDKEAIIKGKKYPNKYIKRDDDNIEDTESNISLTLNGEATGTLQTLAGLKIRGAILNIDLFKGSLAAGVEGNLSIGKTTGITYEKELKIDGKGNDDFEVKGKIDFIANMGLSLSLLNENIIDASKELLRFNIIDFIYPEDKTEKIMNIVNGYWIIDNVDGPELFHRINFSANNKACYATGITEFEAGDISDIEYDSKEKVFNMTVKYSFGTQKESYKIIDNDTLEYKDNNGTTLKYKRSSYKELAYVMYGYQIDLAEKMYRDISTAEYKGFYSDFFMHDLFIDKNKSKDDIDRNLALSTYPNMGSPNDLELKEINVIPNIKGYYVYEKKLGGLSTPTYVFEDGVTPEECKELYRKYAK